MGQWVLAADGEPFTDRDAASLKRDLLAPELGSAFKVEVAPHPHGGFVVDCSPVSAEAGTSPPPDSATVVRFTGARAEVPYPVGLAPVSGSSALTRLDVARPATTTSPPATVAPPLNSTFQPPEASVVRPTVYGEPLPTVAVPATVTEQFRPSLQAFLGQFLFCALGFYAAIMPLELLARVHLRLPEDPLIAAVLLGWLTLAGAFIALLSAGRVIWGHWGRRYTIDDNGLTQYVWRFVVAGPPIECTRLDFAQIGSVTLTRNLLQWLLDIGDLRVTAASTPDWHLTLNDVRYPLRLRYTLLSGANAARRKSDLLASSGSRTEPMPGHAAKA